METENTELVVVVVLIVGFLAGVVCCYVCLPEGWMDPKRRERVDDERVKKPSRAVRHRWVGSTKKRSSRN